MSTLCVTGKLICTSLLLVVVDHCQEKLLQRKLWGRFYINKILFIIRTYAHLFC